MNENAYHGDSRLNRSLIIWSLKLTKIRTSGVLLIGRSLEELVNQFAYVKNGILGAILVPRIYGVHITRRD